MSNTLQADLYTPAEVAALFKVDAKTVTRWAVAGRLSFMLTLGGHRRYLQSEVHALMRLNPGRQPGLPGNTVTIQGDAIVIRRNGYLVKALENLPTGTDLKRLAQDHAEATGATFVEVAS